MKRVLKIIGIVLLVIVAIVAVLLIWLSKKPAVADDYTSKVQPGEAIEAKYLAMGHMRFLIWSRAGCKTSRNMNSTIPRILQTGL